MTQAFFVVIAVTISVVFMIAGFWLVPVALIIKGLTAELSYHAAATSSRCG